MDLDTSRIEQSLASLRSEARLCTRCELASTRTNVVFGSGDTTAELMFIGEAPGKDEDLSGQPFVGRSGKLLARLVEEEMGLSRPEFFIANVVKCRPPANRNPKTVEISTCSPWLFEQIKIVAPRVIITLGNFSSRLLLESTEGITKLRGQVYDYVTPGGVKAKLIPTFHPSAALQGGGADVIAKIRADLVLAKDEIKMASV